MWNDNIIDPWILSVHVGIRQTPFNLMKIILHEPGGECIDEQRSHARGNTDD